MRLRVEQDRKDSALADHACTAEPHYRCEREPNQIGRVVRRGPPKPPNETLSSSGPAGLELRVDSRNGQTATLITFGIKSAARKREPTLGDIRGCS